MKTMCFIGFIFYGLFKFANNKLSNSLSSYKKEYTILVYQNL